MSRRHRRRTWQALIFGINLLLILDTAVFPYVLESSLKWTILSRLNLGSEMNMAVWWAAGLLLLVGIIAYEFSNRDLDSKKAWVVLAILFFLFSFDEIGSIHERVGNLTIGLAVYILMALMAGSALVLASWVLWKNNHDRYGLMLLLTGIALLMSAAPNEYIEHHVHFPPQLWGARVAFEEGLELSGTFICLIGITRCWAASRLQGSRVGFLSEIGSSSYFNKIFLAGFVLHLVIAWISVHYIEIGYRGNPAVWYFMAIFYFLSAAFFLEAGKKTLPMSFLYLLVGGYFMTLSAGSLYFIFQTPASLFRELGLFGDPNVLLGVQLPIIVGLNYVLRRRFSRSTWIQFSAVAIVLACSLYLENQFFLHVASGFFSLVTANLLFPTGSVIKQSFVE